ncbi:MAG: hypothetical protein COT18_02920, partial [Elusimicrobia bacterium CG08_land_8_20_14_0_20_59_10]
MAIGVIAVFGLLAGGGFLLARRSKAALERGVLFGQVNQLVAGWQAQGVPESARSVNLVVDDGDIGALVGKLSKSAAKGAAGEGELLPAARSSGLGGWFRRTFFRRGLASAKPGPLAAALAGNANTVTWTHNGFADVDEEEMAREFMKAILAAHDAGAGINILTRGAAAAPALKALKRLEGVTRANRPVAVRKLVALAMNQATLRKLDPVFFGDFKRPAGLGEQLNLWQPAASGPRRIELYTRRSDGLRLEADKLLAALGLYRP